MNTARPVWPEASRATLQLLERACQEQQPARARYHTAQLILDDTPELALRWMLCYQLRNVSLAHLGLWELLREAHTVMAHHSLTSKETRTVLFRCASALALAPKCSILGDIADILQLEFGTHTHEQGKAVLDRLPGLTPLLQHMRRDDLDLEWKLCQRLHLSCQCMVQLSDQCIAHVPSYALADRFLKYFRKFPLPTAELRETADDVAALMLEYPYMLHLWLLHWALLFSRPCEQLVVAELVQDQPEHCQDALDLELPARQPVPRRLFRMPVLNDYARQWYKLEVPHERVQLIQEHCAGSDMRIIKRRSGGITLVQAYLTESQHRVLLQPTV
jgi:hypothetical protein